MAEGTTFVFIVREYAESLDMDVTMGLGGSHLCVKLEMLPVSVQTPELPSGSLSQPKQEHPRSEELMALSCDSLPTLLAELLNPAPSHQSHRHRRQTHIDVRRSAHRASVSPRNLALVPTRRMSVVFER